jgi:hypothetical protein
LVEQARKIGPNRKGYEKLDKALAGAEASVVFKVMAIAALAKGVMDELGEIEKLLKQERNKLEI